MLEAPPVQVEGLLLVDKESGIPSFRLVSILRRILKVKKIGFVGTLDPFASGLMLMLIGKNYTRLSDKLLDGKKGYLATMQLGVETDSYDCEGKVTKESDLLASEAELLNVMAKYKGKILQTPPMFSAKKLQGKKLYELARQGIEVEREKKPVEVELNLIDYDYPIARFHCLCSKGCYVRSLAKDMGEELGTYAHLTALRRTQIGDYHVEKAISSKELREENKALIQKSLLEFVLR